MFYIISIVSVKVFQVIFKCVKTFMHFFQLLPPEAQPVPYPSAAIKYNAISMYIAPSTLLYNRHNIIVAIRNRIIISVRNFFIGVFSFVFIP